eukprot:CAMPEP_0194040806 /NCGR_PEP_ID=MMETSP0009_2-20130614/12746_1 /TAXON_ID=210454 /ORGANISM="Grammatophora oceanica, Strain CCMP 410" /LENGTH=233 /DNA_ID=CAMNT_0038684059 /DNA_START=91 /DNA_END=792 /DNA_ORIENTATION=+
MATFTGGRDINNVQDLFVLHLFSYMFFPLQGFLNAIIFFHPRVKAMRKHNPADSSFTIIRKVLNDVGTREGNTETMDRSRGRNRIRLRERISRRHLFPIIRGTNRQGGRRMEDEDGVDGDDRGPSNDDIESISEFISRHLRLEGTSQTDDNYISPSSGLPDGIAEESSSGSHAPRAEDLPGAPVHEEELHDETSNIPSLNLDAVGEAGGDDTAGKSGPRCGSDDDEAPSTAKE